ncbi:SpoIIE family protein phosphatase [Asanoa sp. WMMD1127]|uniref:PP2C family protein-serine/threonine phosphatase n=1 Tax=Asanoa sp. WMMD1127 TaxID=3016107 RepID=UPI002416EA2C|nr:GAF domain-containing SpoIIE family protein phosphatase [Asanoa sp. WMMD1127]MDG4825618.1 SpoIIE family protein phosphatase [Asanoa sp. WMMD1127]
MIEAFRVTELGLAEALRLGAGLRAAATPATDLAAACAAVADALHAALVGDDADLALMSVRLYLSEPGADPALVAAAGDAPPQMATVRVTANPAPIDLVVATLGPAAEAAPRTVSPRHAVVHAHPTDDQPLLVDGAVSAFGFGAALPGGRLFAVAAFARVPLPWGIGHRFDIVAANARVALRAALAEPGDEAWSDLAALLTDTARAEADRVDLMAAQARAEAELVGTLQRVGRDLTAELDLTSLVQAATDAATRATEAGFGSFFYNVTDQRGESYMLYTLSGVPREAFARFPMPRNTAVFANTFEGRGTVRSDDIVADPRYGRMAPHHGMPAGHLPVRSYLAVSVVSPSTGNVLGGFFFGHPEPARFSDRHERLAEGIAGHTAIAMDNARLYARQRGTAATLQQAMLPDLPEVPGMTVVSRYLPAATGVEVGGDWMDVIPLASGGRTAFVVGDVMGRGVHAAALMGQIRTAARAYALLDLPPAEVMTLLSRTARGLRAHFITCLYAVHDPAAGTLTYASGGHLPPAVIDPDGQVRLLMERIGIPLAVGDRYAQREIAFPPGSGLFLYTDGLVEDRRRVLDDGLDALVGRLRDLAAAANPEDECDKLIVDLTQGQHDDDIAILYARHRG